MKVFALTLAVQYAAAAQVIPISRQYAADLSYEEFDASFLDRAPVIIKGASICPRGIQLHNVASHCNNKRRFRMSVQGQENKWAGLTRLRKPGLSISDFISSMGTSGLPRYLFDINTFEVCPVLMDKVRIPAHVSAVFMHQWAGEWEECMLGHFNLFVTEQGFRTNLHNDHQNYAFVASMCEGRKRWRIVANADFAAHFKELGGWGGLGVEGRLFLGDLEQPFETWSETSRLVKSNVTVYEGILEPGEMLYIPGGAPHAAETLEHSLMFASNDGSLDSMKQLQETCKAAENDPSIVHPSGQPLKGYCKAEYEKHLHQTMLANRQKHGHQVKREEKSFHEAYRCKGHQYCDALRNEFNLHGHNCEAHDL